MAKKTGYEQFLAEVLEHVSDPTKRAKVEETLRDNELVPLIDERVKARADYSRDKDTLAQEKERFAAAVAQANKNIEGWQEWYNSTVTDYAALQQQLDTYREAYGELEGAEGAHKVTTPSIDENKVVQIIDQRQTAALNFADLLTDIKLEHFQKYGERLNTAEVADIARRGNLPFDQAYRVYIQPKEEERREKEVSDRIEKAKVEAVKEYASTHKLPMPAAPPAPHMLDLAPKAPNTSRDRIAAAVAAFNAGEINKT